ncbi:hypothetical protein HJC23_009611 [Cyclotella cryptica]|uniref:O-fucosyltransferase family protein n=1 Tax=Cyclotella cryptica TaxID=29204 RepID=A0ABD3NUG8_9STRA|eukprot:CCRYP_019593-RA/>CCRYP_019593-RA protein AED:0.35 eAED:0.35 QI:0/-1/0/1/-1/1/1/0/537
MRRPAVNYFVVLLSGFVTWYFIAFIDPFSFIDSVRTSFTTPTTYARQARSQSDDTALESFATLQNPNDLDNRIEKRAIEIASYYSHHTDAFNQRCDNILIYMPDAFAFHGHGSQINTYLMAVLVATYLNRPLLLLEPSGEWNTYDGGSQFGCPSDMFRENNQQSMDGFPNGFSRLIHHPVWLHNGCRIPDSHEYDVWNQVSSSHINPNGMACHDSVSGRDINVIVARGSPLRGFFRQLSNEMVSTSNPDVSLRWAVNLGASQDEARTFVQMKRPGDKWDYALGLMVKSGILRLQPWIARDVRNFLQNVDILHHDVFDGMHVRRGDKLISESRGPVVHYWTSRGFTENNMPLDYIPFEHYLKQWRSPECPVNKMGEIEILEHQVYVATDDPVVVKQEIADLIAAAATTTTPKDHEENQYPGAQLQQTSPTHPVLLFNGCHKLTFYFNPTQEKTFHIAGVGERTPIEGDTCTARYNRNIASMADLWMLARSRTFIGEFNSNWGKLLRVMRLRLIDDDPFSVVLDTRVAWGRDDVGRPGL